MGKLEPNIRFPEFKGKWEEKKIKNIAYKINSGKTPLGGEAVYVNKGILFIRSQNVNNDKLELKAPTFISEKVNETMKNSIVKANDILLNITGASLGRSCVVPKEFNVGNVNQHVCIIRLNLDNNPRFLQPIFTSQKGQQLLESLQTGGGREGLNFESIKNITLPFFSLPEQTKIATFLSAIDEKLNGLKEKKALLEEYKKGMMQQLFSQEVRFKDGTSTELSAENGKNFADWEEKSLGECLSFEQPTKYLVSSTEYDSSYSIPVLTAGKTFILGYTNEIHGVFNDLPAIIFDDFTTATQFVDFPFKAKSSAMKILTSINNHNIKFIYEAMQMIDYEIGGHGRHWISIFSKMEILLPSIEEQTKIANFLSAIDEKIKLVNTQLEEMQVYKKGLLQGMFC